jgi:regulator of sigma E protease
MVLKDIIYFVVLLSVLIFVHELGHFLAAKALNVRVTRFSIGFGPRIFGIVRGETEYQVAWVPLGGYVKMAGDLGERGDPMEDARGFLAQAPWKRALIVGAGPVASLGFPFLLYFILFLAFPQAIDVSTRVPLRTSSRVMSLEPDSAAARAGVVAGDLITSVDGTPVRTFDDLIRAMRGKGGSEVSITLDRNGRPLQFKMVAGVGDAGGRRSRGLLGVSPDPRPALVGVPSGSAAERAGLRTFDRILSVDGRPVGDLRSLEQRVAEATGDVFPLEVLRRLPAELPGVAAVLPERLQLSVPRQPGLGLAALGVELPVLYIGETVRGGPAEKAGLVAGDRLLAVNGEPVFSTTALRNKVKALGDAPVRFTWLHQGQQRSQELTQEKGATFGLMVGPPAETYAGEQPVAHDVVKLGPGAALVAASQKLGATVADVAGSLAMLITGQIPFSVLGGPIMLYGIASQSAKLGLGVFLSTMALISVNLGLLNLLPIPVLDGFGLLSAFWEWIRRRPIPMRAREIANLLGLAVLVLLMLAVFKNDIARLLLPAS